MRELKASTKAGQRIVEMGERCYASSLYQLYNNWSQAKQEAFDWCYEQYLQTEEHVAFGVGSGNTFGFTASWLGKQDGEDIMRVETKDNSYIVWLER